MSKKLSLTDRILAKTSSPFASVLSSSELFGADSQRMIVLPVKALNVAFSGSPKRGFASGITTWAGPSKHFKTLFALIQAAAFLRSAGPDGRLILFDSEFGSPLSYFTSVGINPDQVIHIPVTTIEELRTEVVNVLNEIERTDEIMIMVDSVGNLASAKEVRDAEDGSDKADMTRAKVLKSFFRIVTPKLKLLDLPTVIIQHTYETLEMFSKTVMGGGCVVAGTPVLLGDGTTRPIEDVQVGDIVVTHDGSHPVTAVWDPETLVEGTPECFELELEDGTVHVVSAGHRVLTSSGWVKVSDLHPNQEIQNIFDNSDSLPHKYCQEDTYAHRLSTEVDVR